VFSTDSVCWLTNFSTFFDVSLSSLVSLLIEFTSSTIFTVEAFDSSASFLISSATTLKPFPASPALAASIAALSARRLVCSVIEDIICVIPLI